MAPSETASQLREQTVTKSKTSASLDHTTAPKVTSAQSMEWEHIYSAHNYHPLPVVFSRGLGAKVWDPEGREYLDFLAACTQSEWNRSVNLQILL